MKQLFACLSAALLMVAIGCSGSQQTMTGEEEVVERSTPNRPAWTNAISDERDGYMYITGEITRAKERAFGMTQANADGIQKLLNTMSNNAKATSTQTLRGANMDEGDVGRFSEFAVSWISNSYKVHGITTPITYWEKVRRKTETGVEYFYNCYVQLKMSKKDYNQALAGSYDEIRRKAQAENNAKAEEAAKKLLDDVNKL